MIGLDVLPNCMGVYLIRNQSTNKVYVGSSRDIRKRIRSHVSSLNNRNANNCYLQNAWDKYGAKDFVVILIEVVDSLTVEELRARETYWIDHFHSSDRMTGYNIHRKGDWSVGTLSEETKAKISNKHKGKKMPESFRANISAANKGKKPAPHATQKAIEARQKEYKVTDPSGSATLVMNLSQFCREHALNQFSMYSIASGRRKTHKGWKCEHVTSKPDHRG